MSRECVVYWYSSVNLALRLIVNAAALAAARPTLLLRPLGRRGCEQRGKVVLPKQNLQPKREEGGVESEEFGKQDTIVMEAHPCILTYATEPLPPRGEMDLCNYNNRLLNMGVGEEERVAEDVR